MEHPNAQNLKYGIIYIYSDSTRMTKLHDAAGMLEKLVCPMQIEWIDEPGREGALFVARRFNVGNIGQYATVSLRTSEFNRGGGQARAVHKFVDVLMAVSDTDEGDIAIDESDFEWDLPNVAANYTRVEAPQDHTRVESASRPARRLWRRVKKSLEESFEESMMVESHRSIVIHDESAEPIILQEEDREVVTLERERKEALERIRRDIINYIAHYHDDPKELMAELLRGKVVVGQPGRLLVNGDMKVVLPEYDEMEIKMPAMSRTLYILFLKLRKQGRGGIVLKNIDEYRDDIMNIYRLVKPGANEQRVTQSIDNLCDPFSESLNQMISRINRCVRNVITDKELAKQYIITGVRGEEYSIGLSPEYLELPRAVTS